MSVSDTTVALRKQELLRLLISGKRTREAAKVLGLSPSTCRTYIRCPEFQQKLWNADRNLWARVDEEIRVSKLSTILRIQELSEQALENLEKLMDSDDESIVYKASADILDRNPDASKRSRQDTSSVNVTIDATQLALAAQTAMEMEARLGNRTIDATRDSAS
jgi:predicted transcriptional regulator